MNFKVIIVTCSAKSSASFFNFCKILIRIFIKLEIFCKSLIYGLENMQLEALQAMPQLGACLNVSYGESMEAKAGTR
jgi:hypothetical protein